MNEPSFEEHDAFVASLRQTILLWVRTLHGIVHPLALRILEDGICNDAVRKELGFIEPALYVRALQLLKPRLAQVGFSVYLKVDGKNPWKSSLSLFLPAQPNLEIRFTQEEIFGPHDFYHQSVVES